jgi:hypothetical protein
MIYHVGRARACTHMTVAAPLCGSQGATWSVPRDLSASTKASGVGWISTMDSGAQLSSGRLAIPMDYIHGQWSSYPITHARSSVLYSDDHVRRRSVVSNSPRLLSVVAAR